METQEKKKWDGMFQDDEYNKTIGQTIFTLIESDNDDNLYYSLEDVLLAREDDYDAISYTIYFDTDKPPYCYEMGRVNSKGEMIAYWRKGYLL